MKSFPALSVRPFGLALLGAAAVGAMVVTRAAAATPDPCKLITVAELEQIVGPLKGAPQIGDVKAGDLSCSYTPSKGPAWIEVRLHDGELSAWRSRNGGKSAISVPELGKDAFATPDAEGSADVYAKKGTLILRVSMPKGVSAVDTLKAIAAKALMRL